jgi:hypothetical protein
MNERYIKLLNYVIGRAHSYSSPTCNEAYAWNYISYMLTRAYVFVGTDCGTKELDAKTVDSLRKGEKQGNRKG